MVNQQLRILSKELVQNVFILNRASCHIAHREHSVLFQLLSIAAPHPPEVSEGLM